MWVYVLVALAQCLLWSGAADGSVVEEALARLELARARIRVSDTVPLPASVLPAPHFDYTARAAFGHAISNAVPTTPTSTLPAAPRGGESFGDCTTRTVRADHLVGVWVGVQGFPWHVLIAAQVMYDAGLFRGPHDVRDGQVPLPGALDWGELYDAPHTHGGMVPHSAQGVFLAWSRAACVSPWRMSHAYAAAAPRTVSPNPGK